VEFDKDVSVDPPEFVHPADSQSISSN